MSDFLNFIGNNIRRSRIQQGLTLEELAEKTDLNYSYLGKIERGEKNITLLTLEKLIETLNISPSTLFEFNKNDDQNLNQILNEHERLLKTRNIKEVKMINNITHEIISLIDNPK